MSIALAAALAVAGVVIAALLGAFSGDPTRPAGGPAGSGSPVDPEVARTSGDFLDEYVAGDGRVVRHDQGGDTVSEGQSYAMLLAVADRDRTVFTRVWTWTRDNLQQSAGSFAWRWQDGRVVDPQPATDADLDIVHALQLAATQWRVPTLRTAANRIAAATLRDSTVPVREGRLLTAGAWAVGDRHTPSTLNPSYLVAGEARRLADTTGQQGWLAVARATAVMDRTLLTATTFPPDWAHLAPDARSAADVRPAGAPDRTAGVRYGLDAPRLFVRLAISCDGADRRLAAAAPDAAATPDGPGIRSTDGAAEVSWRHPLGDVVAAAVLAARGHHDAARDALAAAVAQQSTSPSYYGAAWIALGYAELRQGRPDSCTEGTP